MLELRLLRHCGRLTVLGARVFVVVSLVRVILRNNYNPCGSLCSQEYDFLSPSSKLSLFAWALPLTSTAPPAPRHASSCLGGPPPPLRGPAAMPDDTKWLDYPGTVQAPHPPRRHMGAPGWSLPLMGHAPTPVHPVRRRPTGSPGDTVSPVGTAATRATGSPGVTDTTRNPHTAPCNTSASWAASPWHPRTKANQTTFRSSTLGTPFRYPTLPGTGTPVFQHHRSALPPTPCTRDRHRPHEPNLGGAHVTVSTPHGWWANGSPQHDQHPQRITPSPAHPDVPPLLRPHSQRTRHPPRPLLRSQPSPALRPSAGVGDCLEISAVCNPTRGGRCPLVLQS